MKVSKKMTILLVFAVTLIALTSSAFAWSPRLTEKPDLFRAGHTTGYYIWQDNNGFHIWTSARGQEHHFSGIVRTDGSFYDIKGKNLENKSYRVRQMNRVILGYDSANGWLGVYKRQDIPNNYDSYRIDNERDKLAFSFNTARGVDGINFRVKGAKRVHFDLYMDGKKVDPQYVYIGQDGWHPGRSQFTLYR